jgi:hypothetical protein
LYEEEELLEEREVGKEMLLAEEAEDWELEKEE